MGWNNQQRGPHEGSRNQAPPHHSAAHSVFRNVYEAIKGRRHYLPEAKTKHYMFEAWPASRSRAAGCWKATCWTPKKKWMLYDFMEFCGHDMDLLFVVKKARLVGFHMVSLTMCVCSEANLRCFLLSYPTLFRTMLLFGKPGYCLERMTEPYNANLIGGLEHFFFFHILGMSSSQLTFIFFRGVV